MKNLDSNQIKTFINLEIIGEENKNKYIYIYIYIYILWFIKQIQPLKNGWVNNLELIEILDAPTTR